MHADDLRMQDMEKPVPPDTHHDTMQDKTAAHDALQDITQDTDLLTMQDTMQDTMQVRKLLQVCVEEKSREELQAVLGLKNRDYFRKEYLKPAVEAGLLALTIPDKPNSKKQKYRLTGKGKMFLEDQKKSMADG